MVWYVRPRATPGWSIALPDVNFVRYRRLMIDPVSVTFKPGWRRENRKLTEVEVERIRSRIADQFRDEVTRELIERGHYPVAEAPAPDVLRIKASIVDLDHWAPSAGNVPGVKTYARSIGSMTLLVELYDAASDVLVGRIIVPDPAPMHSVPQYVDQSLLKPRRASASRKPRA
jgi:hypothetical protein